MFDCSIVFQLKTIIPFDEDYNGTPVMYHMTRVDKLEIRHSRALYLNDECEYFINVTGSDLVKYIKVSPPCLS